MGTLQDVEWLEPLVDKQRNPEVERYAAERTPAPYTSYLVGCPWILRADIEFDIGCAHIHDLETPVYLTVSRDNSCRFCHGAIRFLMRLAGVSEKEIDQLEEDIDTAQVEPAIDRAMDFARKLSRAKPAPSEADWKELRAVGYSDDAIRELALFAGVVIFHNRFGTLLALPVHKWERLAKSPFARLRRFSFRRILELVGREGTHTPLGTSMGAGPYGALTEALDGLPHARVLREAIDDAWASTTLPRRTRALIFAVIARGLGCETSETEARRLLAVEGLGDSTVDEILAHLASGELSAEESAILPYVRETLWYEPAPVQRRGRALRERLGNEAFLDTVGSAALANMVCRISMAIAPS